jgi:hypothetical protein
VLTLPKVKQVLKSQTTHAKKIAPAPKEVKANEKSGSEGGLSGAVDIRNIVQNAEKEKKEKKEREEKEKRAKVSEVPKQKTGPKVEYDFDESEVPPLE